MGVISRGGEPQKVESFATQARSLLPVVITIGHRPGQESVGSYDFLRVGQIGNHCFLWLQKALA